MPNYAATIYTDGGSRNTGVYKGGHVNDRDKAAWAYSIQISGQAPINQAGGRFGATNNQMEMTAFLEALKKLTELGLQNEPLLFVLDSKYVIDSVTKWLPGWKKNGWRRSSGALQNKELWQAIDQAFGQFTQAELTWTKGHANNAGNNLVDSLLNQFMDEELQ